MKSSNKKKILIGCFGSGLVLLLMIGVGGWFAADLVETAVKDMTGGYLVRNGKVTYNTGLENLGSKRSWEITEADAATFAVLGEGYARDKNYAYLDGVIIPQSDGATFQIIEIPYARDQNYVFRHKIILSDYPNNFKFIAQDAKGIFATDGEKVFLGSVPLFPETLDAKTFERIDSTVFFKDKNHVFTTEKIVEGADPATFEVLPEYGEVYAKDKNSVFYNGVKIENCDVETHRILNQTIHRDARRVFFGDEKISDDVENFQILTSNYSKDSKNAFWGSRQISPDAANFTAFPSNRFSAYAKDGKTVYWCGKKLAAADPASFIGLDDRYGKDKNNVWFGANPIDLPSIVENADPATFKLSDAEDDAGDKNNYINFGFARSPRN